MTPGDLRWLFFMLSALQPLLAQRWLEASRQRLIAGIERRRKSRGGTLIALAADEIVMSEYAVIGPVDPQLGQYPAASLLKAVARKPVAEVDDQTLILADQAEKAIAQVREGVRELLADKCPEDRAVRLARLLSEGTWTHDHPITYETAKGFGLPVRSNIPREFLTLMSLYPQPVRRQRTVEYVPVPRRFEGAPGPQD